MAKKSFKIIPWRARDFDPDLNKELEDFFGNRAEKKQVEALIQEHLDFLYNIEDDVVRMEMMKESLAFAKEMKAKFEEEPKRHKVPDLKMLSAIAICHQFKGSEPISGRLGPFAMDWRNCEGCSSPNLACGYCR